MTSIDGLILAAGRSSRMAPANKVQSVLAGRALIEHAIDRLSPQVQRLFINGDTQTCADLSYPIIADQVEAFRGPLAGLWSALASDYLTDTGYLMIAPCDGPFMPTNLVEQLYQCMLSGDADIACIRYQGVVQSTFSLWNRRVSKAVEKSLLVDKYGGFKPLLQSLKTVYLDWPEQQINPFFNINTTDDLTEAEHILCL